ncbi:MAG: twin-arginine translocation signal domain-containing protein, partial [Lysobacteraceae bacterium]
MTIQRRDFLKHLSVGALAAGIEPSFNPLPTQSTTPPEQKLHPDYQSNNPGTEYFIFGNGKILGALQASPNPDLGTHGGLLVMSSEHFGRKISTYLYHPERGLQNSRFTPIINGRGYLPEFAHSTIHWMYPNGIPTVVLEWEAAGCAVREESFCPIHDSAIIRTVTLRNNTVSAIEATSAMLLYPNLMYFDEYQVDRVNMTLTAKGYKTMQLFSLNKSTVGDRHMNIPFGEIAPGEEKQVTLVFTL